MTHDVFISYSNNDQKVVEALSAYLEQNGIRCFIAYRDISPSAVWAAAITKAIENCKMMVVIFSEEFNRSIQVDREIELCFEESKPILTFKVQDAKFEGAKKYYLKNLHYIDAFPNPKEYFGKLLTNIQNILPDLKSEINNPHVIASTVNGNDLGLMKILSITGVVITLGTGLFGALFGIFHSIVGLKKSLKNTQVIATIGLSFFSLSAMFSIISILNEDSLIICWLFCFIFGIIYSAIWIKKLNKMAKQNGYDMKDLQNQSFRNHKKTILISIGLIIALFLTIIVGWVVYDEIYESYVEYYRNNNNTEEVEITESPFELGKSYFEKSNYAEAVKYFQEAAEQNDKEAQNYLGFMYKHFNTYGLSENYNMAFYWLQKSAGQGHNIAMYNLADLYYNGYKYGLPNNYVKAKYWFQKSYDSGYGEAKAPLDKLKTKGY